MSIFSEFHPLLQTTITDRLGWSSLREVQELSGEEILKGKNCIILAPTAGGKTEASFFPVISKILYDLKDGLRAIYVSPIKALLNNQEERIQNYCSMVGLSAFKWHGDITQNQRTQFLKDPAEILLTTPESLEVMLISPKVGTTQLFKNLEYIIIDEIHAFAGCDRGAHLLSILERIQRINNQDLQRIGLSATIGNPEAILSWLTSSSKRENALIDPPKPPYKKYIKIHYSEDESELLDLAIQECSGKKSLLFCESRKTAEKLGNSFTRRNIKSFVHHSSLSYETRQRAEENFARGVDGCIISTSTMELGIDVGDLDNVFQFESSSNVASFLQRMGRTGRRSNTIANTTFFISNPDVLLIAIAIVELAKEKWVEKVHFSAETWHILLHQIMAQCLQYGGTKIETIWDNIRNASCFNNIKEDEYKKFVEFLVKDNFLFYEDGFLSLGEKAEKVFGRKNFMEIYSVFSSPIEFQVYTISGTGIGTVQQEFAESLFAGQSSFVLAGKAWLVERIEWSESKIIVSMAPAGVTPLWGSIFPKILSKDLCRKIYSILTKGEEYSYLDERAKATLKQIQKDKENFLRSSLAPIYFSNDEILWWTYAGGRINHTLKFAFKCIYKDLEVTCSNEYIKIKKSKFTISAFQEQILEMRKREFWNQPDLMNEILSLMPEYRFSKFQNFLPENLQKEMIANSLLHVEGTIQFLEEIVGR